MLRTSRYGRRRATAALVASAVLLAACTGRNPESSSTTVEDSADARAMIESALGGTQSVQDFLIHLDMAVVAGDEVVPVLDQVVEQARSGAGEAVPLAGGFMLRPVESLTAEMSDGDGNPLPSLSVDFALLESTPEQTEVVRATLQGVIGTDDETAEILNAVFDPELPERSTLVEIVSASYADRFTHAGPGDTSDLDLSFLDAPDGDTLKSAYLFGQTLPGDPEAEAGMTPHELFAYRWNLGLVQMLGDESLAVVQADADLAAIESPEAFGPLPHLLLGASFLVALPIFRQAGQAEDSSPGPVIRKQLAKEMAVAAISNAHFFTTYKWALDEANAAGFKSNKPTSTLLGTHCLRGVDSELVPVIRVHKVKSDKKGNRTCIEDDPVLTTPDHYATTVALDTMIKACRDSAKLLRRKNEAQLGARSQSPAGSGFVGPNLPFLPLEGPPPTIDCEPPPRNDPPQWSAGAIGDVHLVTFDQLFYDNQAAGEFLVFEDGTATVQMRTEPWEDSTIASVATAIAVSIDGTAVSMHRGGSTWIDGESAVMDRGVAVGVGGGAVAWTGTGWVVVWPEGTRMTVDDAGDRLMFTIFPSTFPVGGMLGDGDGDPDNDLVTRDGTAVEGALIVDPPRFYETFIDSWRITADESLFHYAGGETTPGFQIAGFPDHTMTFEDLVDDEAGEAAEQACRDGGVTRPDLLAICVYDLIVTGDDRFVYDHLLMQDALPDPPDESEPTETTAASAPVGDGENRIAFGDISVAFEAFGPAGWCTADDISLGAAASVVDGSGRQVDVSIQYVHADDPLVSVVVQVDRQAAAWVNTMVDPPSGSVDGALFGGGALTLSGSAYANEPFDPGLSPNLPIPSGSPLVPFDLAVRCDS